MITRGVDNVYNTFYMNDDQSEEFPVNKGVELAKKSLQLQSPKLPEKRFLSVSKNKLHIGN